jgi:hypothetical protein
MLPGEHGQLRETLGELGLRQLTARHRIVSSCGCADSRGRKLRLAAAGRWCFPNSYVSGWVEEVWC